MKKILCYGDSNTYGFNPAAGSRFDENTRWTMRLQKNLGCGYEVIEEGMNNRTGFTDNPDGFLYSAQMHFPKLLQKTDKFDVIILAIGTNDLQFQYNISFNAVKAGLAALIETALPKSDKIIIIPPVTLNEHILNGYFKIQFNEESIIKSVKACSLYKRLASAFDCGFFDINKFIRPSDIDGLHYDAAAHKIIAEKLAEYIKSFV